MLSGSLRLVMQACNRLPGDSAGFVDDGQVAKETGIALHDVRACMESLAGDKLIELARLEDHFKAMMTAQGRLTLSQARRFPDEPKREDADPGSIKVVPKGLRSFDEHDADFFLELLPGPRRADGLPDSIHYWKAPIENMDADRTFRVGLIYGPSGCGKSSLVKAGLLPRLSDHVLTVYVEATSNDTEVRLLKELRKRCPALPLDTTLAESVVALSEGRGLTKDTKVLIIIDQFEQWFSSWEGDENTGLIAALMHCDGGHVQAIVMVRDDFWMAVNRFEKQLGVEFRRTLNSYGIDLFDPIHARNVLEEFGRAFDRLPDESGERAAFLGQAVEGLIENGKIAPVRLSLFAWMVRGKPWTPTTLKEVGGAEGVGVNFLEICRHNGLRKDEGSPMIAPLQLPLEWLTWRTYEPNRLGDPVAPGHIEFDQAHSLQLGELGKIDSDSWHIGEAFGKEP